MTPLGYVMLPIGLACFLFSEKWLFRLVVFWTLFSASAAINFGDAQTGSALQVWMFFGTLWFIQRGIRGLSTLSFAIDRRIVLPCALLTLFLCIACASLVMPIFINGRLLISSPTLGDESEAALYLTSHNFTQLLYLIFGLVMAISVAHSSLTDEERKGTEKTLLVSAIFVSLWGAYQFVCNATGIHYPDYIFNNSISPYARGFRQMLDVGVGRISSAAVEPSVFAQSIVAVLPLTIPAWLGKGSVLSSLGDRVAAVLFVLLLVLSTSSTAFLGLAVIAILLVTTLRKTRLLLSTRTFGVIVAAGIGTAIMVVLALALNGGAGFVFSEVLVDKAYSYSAIERLMTVVLAFGYFKKFPLLGVGWGSVTSHDLFVYLLSNVGVIGAGVFTAAMLIVIVRNWRSLDPSKGQFNSSSFSWFLSLSVFLITSAAVDFPLVFGNFWVTLGMAMGAGWKEARRKG